MRFIVSHLPAMIMLLHRNTTGNSLGMFWSYTILDQTGNFQDISHYLYTCSSQESADNGPLTAILSHKLVFFVCALHWNW